MSDKFEEAYDTTTGVVLGLAVMVWGAFWWLVGFAISLAILAAAIGGIVWLFS